MGHQTHILKNKTDVSASEHIGQRKEATSKGQFLVDNRLSSLIQKKENNTGLPDNLKSGIENMSGYSMDDVNVHYNSAKPAQLNAHAYAQGTDIHLSSGQEKHLPHEAWHVVQQKQGRVQPTTSVGGAQINDNEGLETEADVMGRKALNTGINETSQLVKKESVNEVPIQMFNKGVAAFGGLAGFVLAGANPLLGLGLAMLGGAFGGNYGDNLFRDEEEDFTHQEEGLPVIEEVPAHQEEDLPVIEEDLNERGINLENLLNTHTGRYINDLVDDDHPELDMNPQHLAIGTDNNFQDLVTPILRGERDAERVLPTFLTGDLYNQAEEFTPERNREFIGGFIDGIPGEGEEGREDYRVSLNHNMARNWRGNETFDQFVQDNFAPRENREYDGTRQEIRDLLDAGFQPSQLGEDGRMELSLQVNEEEQDQIRETLRNRRERDEERRQEEYQRRQFGERRQFGGGRKNKEAKDSWRKKK
ncbi:DUF4157 domain-containing protein [uncultured Tenacibaculum sp.]|uniref:eCIS core domain-containing protein n=1 Tax=uncultured Tenacibaculum sp. TaxID=174713 RepID=UPI002607ACD7|nr:DUF4157 domain-containing protein [uncultured Tenacibaculum sp.]